MTVLSARQKWFKDLVGKHASGDVKAFAVKSGVDRSTVSQYVNARKEPSDKHVIRVANRLNVSPPMVVLEYTPGKEQPAQPKGGMVPSEEYEELVTLAMSQLRALNALGERMDRLCDLVEQRMPPVSDRP